MQLFHGPNNAEEKYKQKLKVLSTYFTCQNQHVLPHLNSEIFLVFIGGKKYKPQYLNEVQNGCTHFRIRIGQNLQFASSKGQNYLVS